MLPVMLACCQHLRCGHLVGREALEMHRESPRELRLAACGAHVLVPEQAEGQMPLQRLALDCEPHGHVLQVAHGRRRVAEVLHNSARLRHEEALAGDQRLAEASAAQVRTGATEKTGRRTDGRRMAAARAAS